MGHAAITERTYTVTSHMAEFVEALFGGWHVEAATAKTLDLDAPAPPATWRLDVSPDAHTAHRQIASQHAQLARDQRDLELATQRLAAFVDAWEPSEAATEKSLGPEASAEAEASPENNLAATLALANQPQAKGLLDDPLQAARAEFERFVQRVRELTSSYAHIETKVAGSAIGRTVVGWTGDFKSVWDGKVSVEQIALHRQNVRMALARRAMLVKLLIVVSTGAAKIALRLATPGAQLLVIPAVWQFVKDVIAQIQALNAATPSRN